MMGRARADFDDALSSADLRELATHPDVKVLQCSRPVRDAIWKMLNEEFFAARPDVELRVFAHYGMECDLGFARGMTNVRRFAADSLMRARNVEAIAEIPHLTSLSLGIFELRDFSVLERIPATLTSLFLSATRSKKPNLAPLRRFRSMRVLYVEGHNKDLGVLLDLHDLEDVTLRSITTPDLRFLMPLRNLWSLDIKLGGIRSFAGIEEKESIKYLELWQIRDLSTVDIVGTLPSLQNLFLQSLPHIESLPSLRSSKMLRRVVLQNLKGLSDLRTVEHAPALNEFALVEGNKQTPDQLVPVLRNSTLRRVSAHFGSERKNREFARLRELHGKEEWKLSQIFEYR
jgi:hypothetical protein